MSHAAHAVETTELTKRFGDHVAVDEATLVVPRGATFGLLGPNGAGKTTLMRLFLGLTPVSAGAIRLLGRRTPQERERALQRVGAIVEEPRFHAHMSGRQNLWAIAAARGGAAFDRIDSEVARVGMTGRVDDRVGTYSMGMRQRLGLAVCLIADPELLILDEPMNGLDPAGVLEFRDLIRQLADEGRTVVISSHLLDEIERTCDHIAIIDRGRVVVQGELSELTAGSAPVARFSCARPTEAARIVAGCSAVERAVTDGDGIRAQLACGSDAAQVAADLNRLLVLEGIAVYGFELIRPSLEQRFLESTNRFGAAA